MAARVTSGSWPRERRLALPRLVPRRLRSLHTLALVMAAILVGWLGWTWYRGSSFVKIQDVRVTGLSGPDVPQIRADLTASALQMTTLSIDMSRLERSVAGYPFVRSLTVTSNGAHRVTIRVAEQVPVAAVDIGGRSRVVDAEGGLLPGNTTVGFTLPVVPVSTGSAGNHVTSPGARAAIAVLAAAPYALLAHIANATTSSLHGVIVQLRNGPQLYFGPTTQLRQKWDAAVAVLQNSASVGASYIDVTDPNRPAPGAGVAPSQASALGLDAGATTTTAGGASPAGAGGGTATTAGAGASTTTSTVSGTGG